MASSSAVSVRRVPLVLGEGVAAGSKVAIDFREASDWAVDAGARRERTV